MESLGSALTRMLEDVGIDKAVKQQKSLALWPEIVGTIISEVTTPKDVEHGVLTIKTANATWRQELFFRKRDIIKKLNTQIGEKIIKDIRFL